MSASLGRGGDFAPPNSDLFFIQADGRTHRALIAFMPKPRHFHSPATVIGLEEFEAVCWSDYALFFYEHAAGGNPGLCRDCLLLVTTDFTKAAIKEQAPQAIS